MVRRIESVLVHVLPIAAAAALGGCLSTGEEPVEITNFDPTSERIPEVEEKKFGFPIGGLFGKKEKGRENETESVEENQRVENAPQPKPRKIPIGTIHLVHQQGGFVLIQSDRMTEIPREAELMTYSEEGKPTGKLRISPERKGKFRVADILAGHPQQNDRVMLFGMEKADGSLIFGSEPDSEGAEVLE